MPTAGVPGLTDLRAERTIWRRRQTIQSPPQGAGAKVYSLLDGGPTLGTFLYGYRLKYLPPKQQLAHNEFFTHEVEEVPRPLLQLDFGSWSFPVMLSGAAASR